MHRFLCLALVLLLGIPLASAQGADHLVGRPYAGLPGGWAETSGMLVPAEADANHALSEHRNVYEDSGTLFTYARLDYRVDDRHPVWTILAALVVEDIREGETATAFGCQDESGAPVIAVVGEQTLDEAEYLLRYGPVRLAWAFDATTEQFTPIAPDRVSCPDQDLP